MPPFRMKPRHSLFRRLIAAHLGKAKPFRTSSGKAAKAGYLNCLGGGGFCESSDEPFAPVSENISLIVPTAESMVEVSTGMKMTFALLLFVMSRRLSI